MENVKVVGGNGLVLPELASLFAQALRPKCPKLARLFFFLICYFLFVLLKHLIEAC